MGCEPLSSFLRVHAVGCSMCLSRYMDNDRLFMIWGWTASTNMLPDPKLTCIEKAPNINTDTETDNTAYSGIQGVGP
jgi:hypothetical protein